MTSYCMRNDTLFMRNTFSSTGKWGIPLVKKQNLPFPEIDLIACSDTRANDDEVNRKKGVHFFVDDYRFSGIYNHPERSLKNIPSTCFYLLQIFPHMPTWIFGDSWKVLPKIAG